MARVALATVPYMLDATTANSARLAVCVGVPERAPVRASSFSHDGQLFPDLWYVTAGMPVAVTVAEASFPDQPVVWTGQERTWRCPGIGTNVQVDFEAGVAAVRTDTATGAVFSLRMERTESRTAVARLGGTNGVPADSTRVHGFTTYSSTDFPREVWFLDGGAHREATLFLAEAAEALPEDMEVHVEAVGTGVFIEVDGNLSNAVTVASADWNGGSIVYWIAADSWSAICNSLWVEQAGERVGSR